MGGHFVQGHVDTTAEIIDKRPDGNAVTFRFQPKNREVLRYVVFKGFVAIDGASLTVTKVNDEEGWWEVMLIAYTQERVVTAAKEVGQTVNVEVDMTAKYVEKGLMGYLEGLEKENGEGGVSTVLERMVQRAVEKALAERK